MPAYNHERFVGAAVESVLDQTYADLELIVIDDGSTDRTGEIVQSYADPRIRYIHQENQDAFNALNRGMSLSEGSYISIIHSDDVYQLEIRFFPVTRFKHLDQQEDPDGPTRDAMADPGAGP